MKKFFIILTIFTAIIFLINLIFSQEFTYVGAGKCKICHKSENRGKQFLIWEESKHYKSFLALTSEKIQEKARELGLENPAENEKCLKCHAPLFEKASEFKKEGITCEICHGPGSAYKKLSIMKSREESVKNGLRIYQSPEEIKALCLTCHENAHEKSFDFDSYWRKIKHPVPEKK